MKTRRGLSKAIIERQLDEAWRAAAKESGLLSHPDEIKTALKEAGLSPDFPLFRAMTLGMSIGLSNFGRVLARNVRTQEQLETALQEIRQYGEKLPTVIRQTFKQVVQTLPRRGGPGRKPKLNPKEASLVCDQVALFIRRKCGLKDALKLTAELTPSILGKKVGARTIQKAWGMRDQFAAG